MSLISRYPTTVRQIMGSLDWPELAEYATIAKGRPCISVGSGSGEREKFISEKIGQPVYCVEPYPASWPNVPPMYGPHYHTVSELVDEHPEFVGKCALFVLWEFPNGGVLSMDAIGTLKPEVVIGLYEASGAAGCWLWHRFMAHVNAPCSTAYFDEVVPTVTVPRNIPLDWEVKHCQRFDGINNEGVEKDTIVRVFTMVALKRMHVGKVDGWDRLPTGTVGDSKFTSPARAVAGVMRSLAALRKTESEKKGWLEWVEKKVGPLLEAEDKGQSDGKGLILVK